MPSSFITNNGEDKNLKKRLTELVSASQELKFLVGFFYFSGIQELYETLKEKVDNNEKIDLKVLVGLEAGNISSQLVEFGNSQEDGDDNERADKFIENIVEAISDRKFDREEFYKQAEFFLKLIKEDKLKIRKTYNPNHAKVYIFNISDKHRTIKDRFVITGSSNLTKSGLSGQNEFNVELSDFATEEAEKYFDKLWRNAVEITEVDEIKEKLIEKVKNESMIAQPTPFEAFTLTLKKYLESVQHRDIEKSLSEQMQAAGYDPYQYQIDAVEQALSIIEEDNGVIIADVVGLGKSVIASLIAKQLNVQGRGLVISPPGLMGDENKTSGWNKYINDFDLYGWETRSTGKLEDIEDYVNDNDDIEVIIVDEAHRFKNQDTQSYESLSNICKNKIVILLTATPFNNSPDDIFSLLKLFIVPKKSSITLSNNAEARFSHYQSVFDDLSFIKKHHENESDLEKYDKAQRIYENIFGSDKIDIDVVKQEARKLASSIRNDIEPVIIRRNRIDLKKDPAYSDEVNNLSDTKDPEELFFELTEEQLDFYDRVTKDYFGEHGEFNGAIYRPYSYEAGKKKISSSDLDLEENREYNQQKNLFDFMRRLLVKRFESSFGAFEQSIKNFQETTEAVLKFIETSNRYILDRGLIEKVYQGDEDEIEDALEEYKEELKEMKDKRPKKDKVYHLESFVQQKEFINDIKEDLKLFEKLIDELEELNLVDNDPKIDKLANGIDTILNKTNEGEPKRKVVVFSEYVDTIEYITPKIEERYPGRVLSVTSSLTDSTVNEILENFDASHDNQKDDYDILLATDKLSEGFNLNRAGAIVNYDIPWNPTRVIQRLGRINRIGTKVFDDLYIYNFFPTEKGANFVRSKEIASEKMFLIHNTLGEDAKIFDPDEEPTESDLYRRLQKNPEEGEEESFYTKVKNKLNEIKEEHSETLERVEKLSPRVKTAMEAEEDALTLFIKKGRGFYVRKQDYESEEIIESTFEEVYDDIECGPKTEHKDLSDEFWGKYEELKDYKEESKTLGKSAVSIRSKARTNLRNLKSKEWDKLKPLKSFVNTLLEDLLEYGTLPQYTLRRIAEMETQSKDIETDEEKQEIIDELKYIKDKLGPDYLEEIKQKTSKLSKEVIIAIEQQSNE